MCSENFYQYVPDIPDIMFAGMFSIIVEKNARQELKFPGILRKILNIPGKAEVTQFLPRPNCTSTPKT